MSHRKEDFVALMEIGGSHDECLYSQLYSLTNSGRTVTLICTQEIRDRNPGFESLVDSFIIVSFTKSKFKNKGILRGILKSLKQKGVSKLVLNTAQGSKVRSLSMMALFSKIEFIGIIHTTRKFEGSFTQKLINLKIKKYFMLSEYLLSRITPPRGINVDYFYPIRYQGYSKSNPTNETLEVTVIGGVENIKKDLDGFIKMVANIDQKVNFTFLGKSNPELEDVNVFQALLKKEGIDNMVTTFDHFISQETFDAHLKKTDAILLLIHPNTESAEYYFKHQISGAMNVAFGYKIPMLIHEHYNQIEEMQGSSIYYNFSNFGHRLSERNQFVKTRSEMESNPLYNVELQEKRFLNFLFEQ